MFFGDNCIASSATCTLVVYGLYGRSVHLGCTMSATALTKAKMIEVNRSELRQNQSALLRRAQGSSVLLIKANDESEEKVVLDKKYFDEIRQQLEAVVETLEITMDGKLFKQILAAADTLDEDLRLGKLHSLEDAFAEE
jgi:hypothetical protein